MQLLFSTTLFVSALLLFLVQPMIAKMILPTFGGAPAVWNTCMLSFQTALLAGYAYAHLGTRWLGVRGQAVVHLLLLGVACLSLPVRVSPNCNLPAHASPILEIIGILACCLGLPFFALSASAPLLQRWYASTGDSRANDPYFLYAASNLGSMLALFSYPILVEPVLSLRVQSYVWSFGYGLLLVLVAICAVFVWRTPASATASTTPKPPPTVSSTDSRQRCRWLVFSFVPSSMLLGLNTYLATDIASFPLMWVIPLALYLLTFILAFASPPAWLPRGMAWTLPFLIVLLLGTNPPRLWLILLHLLIFFVSAMICHGRLAATRPPVSGLTEFYLLISLGGVLGGVWNNLLAPLVFASVGEYPLAIVLACLCLPALTDQPTTSRTRIEDVALPVLLGLFAVALCLSWIDAAMSWRRGIPALVALGFLRRPVRFGLGVGALLVVHNLHLDSQAEVLYQERNFFGVLRVLNNSQTRVHSLIHGNILHGTQRMVDDRNVRRLPLLYYDPTGPIGQLLLARVAAGSTTPVAVVGLGVGALASYGERQQDFTFFEIDPAVERIARDPRYFTFLSEGVAQYRVVHGDARLSLAREPAQHYGLIIVDAFSSDAIPIHLLTVEALELYLDKLAEGGIVALHLSNNFLDLEPVVAALAQAKGLVGLRQFESAQTISDIERRRGKKPSHWVLLARTQEDFSCLRGNDKWRPLVPRAQPLWTDDYSNLLGVIRW